MALQGQSASVMSCPQPVQLSNSRVVERAGGQGSEPSGHAETRGSQEGDAGEQHRGGGVCSASGENDRYCDDGAGALGSFGTLLD